MARLLVRTALAVLTIAIAVIGWNVFRIGAFRSVEPGYEGQCLGVPPGANAGKPVIAGVEDIVIDHERRVAWLSAYDRRTDFDKRPQDALAGLFRLNLDDTSENAAVQDATPSDLPDVPLPDGWDAAASARFSPHGIDLYISPDGAMRRLFVIDHAPGLKADQSRILIFDVDADNKLALAAAPIAGDWLKQANDLAAVGPEEFYVTYMNGDGPLTLPAALLGRGGGRVYHYRNGDAHAVVDGLIYANGVAWDRTADIVYVSETFRKTIRSFRRDPETGDLSPLSVRSTRSGGDNFTFGPDGDLYLAGHSNQIAFVRHASDPGRGSPADVTRYPATASGDRLEANPAGALALTATGGDHDPFADSRLAGASVAAPYDGGMLVGSVFEPRVWSCRDKPD